MIEVRGLTKRYGDVVAVDDLSFDVERGLVTGFLGPNGAGKSTTMRMVLGSIHPGSTGRNHLRVAAHTNGIGDRRVDEVIEQVGLEDAARRPINGLDLDGVCWIRELPRRLADDGRTVLVSSHHERDAADRRHTWRRWASGCSNAASPYAAFNIVAMRMRQHRDARPSA